MPIFKSKLEVLIADVKKLDEKAKKLTPEEYEAFKKEVEAIYVKVDEVADEAHDQVVNEEVHTEEHPEDEHPEDEHHEDPAVDEHIDESESHEEHPDEVHDEDPIPEVKPDEIDVKKEISELKDVVKAQSMKIESLEDKLSKYEGFGEGEHHDDEHKDVVIKGATKSTELMHKYFGN